MKTGFVFCLFILFFNEVWSQTCDAPTASDVTICGGPSATLIAAGPDGGTYQWYNSASGGTLITTGAAFITPPLTVNTTYYVQVIIGACTSFRTPVTVHIRPAPSVSGASICSGENARLTATGPGGNYEWYDALSGGNLIQTGSVYVTLPIKSKLQIFNLLFVVDPLQILLSIKY